MSILSVFRSFFLRYVASKCAILGLTVSAAKDLARFDIRVNAVSPALIGPGFMWDRQNELHAACDSPFFANDAETVAKNKIGGVPMKRLGSVEEVVDAVRRRRALLPSRPR